MFSQFSSTITVVVLVVIFAFMLGYYFAQLKVFDLFKYPPRITTPAPLPKILGMPSPSSDAVTKAQVDQMMSPRKGM